MVSVRLSRHRPCESDYHTLDQLRSKGSICWRREVRLPRSASFHIRDFSHGRLDINHAVPRLMPLLLIALLLVPVVPEFISHSIPRVLFHIGTVRPLYHTKWLTIFLISELYHTISPDVRSLTSLLATKIVSWGSRNASWLRLILDLN
jgi:hypothetical protein